MRSLAFDKVRFFNQKVLIFPYFSLKTYVVGSPKSAFMWLLVSTYSMLLWSTKKTIFGYPFYLDLCYFGSALSLPDRQFSQGYRTYSLLEKFFLFFF